MKVWSELMCTLSTRRIAGILSLAAALGTTACTQDSPQALVAQAQAALDKKDARSAVVHLKSALQADPASAPARVLLGRALLESGDPAGAEVELSKSLDQKADMGEVLPLLARALLLTGQGKKLVTLYGGVTLQDKTVNAGFMASLATAWALVGEKTKADAAIAAALAAVPDLPDALILQARLMAGSSNFDGAMAIVDKVLSRDPKLYEALHLRGEIQLVAQSDAKAAEASFREALAVERSYVPSHLALISARLQARDIAGAKAQLADLKTVAPASPETVFKEAQVAYFDKDYAGAKETVQKLMRTASDNIGLLELAAAIEWQTGSLVTAERHLSTAIQRDPTLANARINLAHIQIRLGLPARALESIKPLIESASPSSAALAVAGDATLQLGNLADAEDFLARAVAAAPADSRNRTALALTQLARGDQTKAFSQLETLASGSKDSYADIALISARLRQNDLNAALAAADALVRKEPGSASAHDLRGRVLLARRDDAGARSAFKTALSLEPRFFAAISSLAEIDMRDKQVERARKRFEDLIKEDPRNYLAVMGLADVRYREGVPLDQVRETIKQAVKAAPTEPDPRLKLIEMLTAQRQVKAALAEAQDAAAAIPDNVRVLDALGRMQVADGNLQQALSTFKRITTIDGNSAMAYTRMAEVHRAEGNRGAAVANLRRAVEIDPRLKAARINLVEILVDEKRSKEALEIARDLQRREPQSSGGYLLEAAVHRKMKNHDGSVSAYRAGLQKATDRGELAANLFTSLLASGAWKAAESFGLDWIAKNPGDGAMHYYLGEGYLKAKDFRSAEKRFTEALALRPDYVPALNNLAWVLVQQGKPGAVESAQKAVELLPSQPALLDTLATALAAEKRLPEALATQQKAVDAAPGDAALRLHLAKLALQAGDKAMVRRELDRLVAMGSRNPYQDEVGQMLKGL